LPTVKATGSRKRKATDQPTRNTKYMRGVSVGETTTRLPSNDSDGTAKYKKKKSTADKQMFNSDETGFDILAWVSSKTFDSYFMNYIYSVIFCYRKFKLTFKLAPNCYAFVLTLCIRTWLPTVLIIVVVKKIFSSKGFFLVYSGTQFFWVFIKNPKYRILKRHFNQKLFKQIWDSSVTSSGRAPHQPISRKFKQCTI